MNAHGKEIRVAHLRQVAIVTVVSPAIGGFTKIHGVMVRQ